MDNYLFLTSIDDYSRKLVKFAVELPEDKYGEKAKNQLFITSANIASSYKLSCIEALGQERVNKLNTTLENLSISNFWLEFAKNEQLANSEILTSLLNQSSSLTHNIIEIRNNEKHKMEANKSFAGEWLLDD